MREDSSYLALEVRNDFLVLDIEHLAREDILPVFHQALVLQVVFTQLN